MLRLGIDLGGSKIEIAAFDDAGGEILRRRVPTPQGDYWATLGAGCTTGVPWASACPAPNPASPA